MLGTTGVPVLEPQPQKGRKRGRSGGKTSKKAQAEPLGKLDVATPTSPLADVGETEFWNMFRPPHTYKMPQGTLRDLYEWFCRLSNIGLAARERNVHGLIFCPTKSRAAATRRALEFDAGYAKTTSKSVTTILRDEKIIWCPEQFEITIQLGPTETFTCSAEESREPLANLVFVYLIGFENPFGRVQVTRGAVLPQQD